ncbi:hypothetical protein [Burkholderia ubonensis]|uniref:hypothetical protein n=1 Tax=Burkholderia ubonensis TaxID=101571 RepID=UPI000AF87E9C|nr:hypothetical protein [Burkholderia ubonensis]
MAAILNRRYRAQRRNRLNEDEEQLTPQPAPDQAPRGQCFKTGQACGFKLPNGAEQNQHDEVADVSNR